MSKVTVTGRAWDGSQDPIPANLQPRLWFKPTKPFVSTGLQADVEVDANLQSNGSFSAELESYRDVEWIPILDWLVPGTEDEPPEKRARGHVEWPAFFPANGGDISNLFPRPAHGKIPDLMYGFGPLASWPWDVVYLDLSDPAGVGVYGPTGMSIDEWSANA